LLEKHSISIRGHRTSYTLEPEFYAELKRIAREQEKPLARMITELDETRPPERNLSSTLRVFVLENLKQIR
jgi:predicted DNA-binding ribbon-helix-helix protein